MIANTLSTDRVLRIPGMIERVEQNLLFSLAQSLAFSPGENVVEFGTFFGRSTFCLAEGLVLNPTFTAQNSLVAYDSFSCATGGTFAPYVYQFAREGGVEYLLKNNANRVDFKPVFEYYLSEHIDAGLLKAVQIELADSLPPSGPIALLHIDSPKFYAEFKTIAFRFLPRVRSGATVVFQDFFYHWSASLVAVVVLMVKAEILSIAGSAASSLVTRVKRVPTLTELMEFDLTLEKRGVIPELVDQAIELCGGTELDRKDSFLPRLHLAKFQALWESGNHPRAAKVVADFFGAGNKLNQAVVNDFMEMLGKGFSVRKNYEQDHPAERSS